MSRPNACNRGHRCRARARVLLALTLSDLPISPLFMTTSSASTPGNMQAGATAEDAWGIPTDGGWGATGEDTWGVPTGGGWEPSTPPPPRPNWAGLVLRDGAEQSTVELVDIRIQVDAENIAIGDDWGPQHTVAVRILFLISDCSYSCVLLCSSRFLELCKTLAGGIKGRPREYISIT